MRSVSILDFLCMDFLLKKFGLPQLRFVTDLGLGVLEPFGRGTRRLLFKKSESDETLLADAIAAQQSALLFLRRPPTFGNPTRKGEKAEVDLLKALVALQRTTARPILLMPETIVWAKLPGSKERSVFDWIFGPIEWAGRVRTFFQFLFNFRNVQVRSGEPFDIASFVAQHQELTDTEIADKLRYALLRRIERERSLVIGPMQKSAARIRDEILRSPRLRKQMEAAARAEKTTVQKIEASANNELKKLCADPDSLWQRLLHGIFDRVWNRLYDGMVIDTDGLDRVREAARVGNIVLLPTHKSHVDYLVLSDVLYTHGMSPPLIAAGDNLNFWPVGSMLRKAGGFFIKRSFRAKRVYSALVEAYIRKIMVEGFSLEFFIEGGRSRTGKVLKPQVGLLSMVVDAALTSGMRKTFFVPISIGYERVIEERSYALELGGGEKKKENVGELLKSQRVFRSRYGRLYIQFGDVISLEEEHARALGAGAELTPPQRRGLVQSIAQQAIHEMERVTIVTLASLLATVLLAHRRRGISHAELVEHMETLAHALADLGARLAPTARDERGKLRREALEETTALFVEGKLIHVNDVVGERIYAIADDRRIALEYYGNNIAHFLLPTALLSVALRSENIEHLSREILLDRAASLADFFRHDFALPSSTVLRANLEQALTRMEKTHEIELISDSLRITPGRSRQTIARYARLLVTYFEARQVGLRALAVIGPHGMARKEWMKKALRLGEHLYRCGEIQLQESVSQAKLEHALLLMKERGLVAFKDGDSVIRATDESAVEATKTFEDFLSTYAR